MRVLRRIAWIALERRLVDWRSRNESPECICEWLELGRRPRQLKNKQIYLFLQASNFTRESAWNRFDHRNDAVRQWHIFEVQLGSQRLHHQFMIRKSKCIFSSSFRFFFKRLHVRMQKHNRQRLHTRIFEFTELDFDRFRVDGCFDSNLYSFFINYYY